MSETKETVAEIIAKRNAAEDARLAHKLEKARERIRKNFPAERAPLQWRRVSENRLTSHCNRFSIERTGTGDAARYTAILEPASIIGARRYTVDEAKQDCNRHASPLPLEPEPSLTEAVEREPGSDDE
jgi:hypothetical protein